MEVIGTALSVTQTLFSALQSPELKQILSIYGYESKLEELQSIVNIIKAVFRDAQTKQELSNVAQQWIEDLKDVVFEADDLLDEFVTLAKQKQHVKANGTISRKMRLFLSRSNPFGVAYKMSKEVEKIRKKLDAFAYNKQFMMEFSHEPIRYRKPETCSYVDVVEVVGREDDLEHIVGKLLDSDVQTSDVSFLPIVGMGGLGKTALAQLVYNDKRVETTFSLRLWHCVSDQDQKQLDIDGILCKILALITRQNHEGSSKQIVHNELINHLLHKKYLLVLDDVWTENCNQWNDLVRLLKVGQRGSWIVVTTRSEETAKFIGNGSMYKLQGLGMDESKNLFEKVAFGSERLNLHDELVEIGQKIIEACGGVPLALRVAGSLVYGQDKKKWQTVKEVGVANMGNNDITQILKLSYHHLPFSLKNCFIYCAVFPKDYTMRKDMLINLWTAHNYIVPLHEGQSIEDAGEEHFLILLRRCFFQDIVKDVRGDLFAVKMHDLLHDIAQGIAMKEILPVTTNCRNLDKKVRHISLWRNTKYENFHMSNTRVRSYINESDFKILNVETIINSCRYLRVLKLSKSELKLENNCLSNSLGKLIHLRYLDLSDHNLEVFPSSVTKLSNLETLILYSSNLKELPKNFSRLVKLRVLDISYCSSLNYMPKGMDKLTCLSRLSDFIIGGEERCSNYWREWFLGLEELKALNNLRGRLRIQTRWSENIRNITHQVWEREGLYLKDKEHLSHIEIDMEDERRVLDDEKTIKLMEDLQPPSSVKVFKVYNYHGKRMTERISYLPNLVDLVLYNFDQLEYLEIFGNIEEGSFLPSLQKLELRNLPVLKGWRRGGMEVKDNNSQLHLLPYLPSLKQLRIIACPELTCFPMCPKLEVLLLRRFSKRLKGIIKRERNDKQKEVTLEVRMDDVAWFNSLPIEAIQCVTTLVIRWDKKVESFREFEKVFRFCSSLQYLHIEDCVKLKSVVAEELEYLSALEILERKGALLPSLRFMSLGGLPKLVSLPNWMQFLPTLETLEIKACTKLKAMPKWMPKITSLKQLSVFLFSEILERRCKEEPEGEDWPYMRHIPTIQFIKGVGNT